MAQWVTNLISVKMRVQSLASLGGLAAALIRLLAQELPYAADVAQKKQKIGKKKKMSSANVKKEGKGHERHHVF